MCRKMRHSLSIQQTHWYIREATGYTVKNQETTNILERYKEFIVNITKFVYIWNSEQTQDKT